MTKQKMIGLFSIGFLIVVGLLAYYMSPVKHPNQLTTTINDQGAVKTETFILMGDAGTGSEAQYQVASSIEHYCDSRQTCQAVFILGDVIYNEGVTSVSDLQFDTKFETPYANINYPFYIAYGNHDYLGCTKCYLEYAEHSTKWKMPSRYYVEEFETAKFFVIDTEVFDTEQQSWLEEQLAQPTDKTKIVVGHRPLMSDEQEKHLENWKGKQELAAMVCNQANYYVSGHAHILEDVGSLENCQTHLLISGTAGSYPRQAIRDVTSPFIASINGFLALSTGNLETEYQYVDKDGNILHSNRK